MEAHLEFIPSSTEKFNCSWEHSFTDYDGTTASVMCAEQPEVFFVYEDMWGAFDGESGEILAIEFCRPHGNLVLIQERKEGAR